MTKKVSKDTPTVTHSELLSLLKYDPKTGMFTWKVNRGRHGNAIKAGTVAGYTVSKGYRQIQIHGKAYRTSRLAWFYVYERWPPQTIDHINRIHNDDRIENLRLADYTQQAHNQKKPSNNTSGYTGVYFRREKKTKPWRALIGHKGRVILLGEYNTKEEAAKARAKHIKKIAQEFYNKEKE